MITAKSTNIYMPVTDIVSQSFSINAFGERVELKTNRGAILLA